MTVARVDPHDDDVLRAWYDVWDRGLTAGRTWPCRCGYAEISATLRARNDYAACDAFVGWAGGAPVGGSLLRRPLTDNRHLLFAELAVAPEHRRRGHGSALLAHAEALAAEEGRTSLFGEVYEPVDAPTQPGTAFAERHGFVSRNDEHHLLLELPGEPPPAPATGSHRVWTWSGPTEPRHLDALAGLFTTMSADVPVGELDFEPAVWDAARVTATERHRAERGFVVLTSVAVAPAGEFVGYSQLLVSDELPEDAVQEDTLVLRAHRGHRLGLALKAANLRLLAERFPRCRRVHTWNATSNTAMLAVNTDLGFRLIELGYGYQRQGLGCSPVA